MAWVLGTRKNTVWGRSNKVYECRDIWLENKRLKKQRNQIYTLGLLGCMEFVLLIFLLSFSSVENYTATAFICQFFSEVFVNVSVGQTEPKITTRFTKVSVPLIFYMLRCICQNITKHVHSTAGWHLITQVNGTHGAEKHKMMTHNGKTS